MKQREILIRFKEFKPAELTAEDKSLVNIAIESALNAYAPYSHFRVGAAVLLSNDMVIKGNNQENAAYPSGLCAERVAMFYANANYPESSVKAIAVVVVDSDGNVIEQNISPCGSCRQALAESEMRFKKPIKILLASKDSVLIFNSVEDLLPLSFNQGDLDFSK
ncbi:MAG TPA: cytidine deaminase [Bacteroidales bacterium]|nr:cytidine deaminase [Bacteroidales bacterium]